MGQRLRGGVTLCLWLTALGGACASPQRTAPPDVVDPIYRGDAEVTEVEANARLREVRVVYVAERHGDPVSLTAQRRVAQRLRRLGPVIVAVEWLPRSLQPVLDAWNRGSIARSALRDRLGWDTGWGHAWRRYEPMFLWSREQAVKMVALNAEPGLSRAVAKGQESSLARDQRRRLPRLNSGTEAHFRHFASLMNAAAAAHGGATMSEVKLRRHYRAQLVWDETMAQGVRELLESVEPNTRVMVCAGGGHILYGHGIPERVSRPHLIIQPAAEAPVTPTPLSHSGRRRADWVWVVRSPR